MTTDNASTPEFQDPADLKPKQLREDIERARAELAQTLDAIEYKLNVPKQVSKATERAKRRIAITREENPSAIAAGVVGVLAAVGLAAWAVVKAVTKD